MPLTVVGINHHTAPVALREKLAFTADELPGELRELVESEDISEAVILSTCNRTEVYVTALTAQRGSEAVTAFLERSRHLDEAMSSDLERSRYMRGGSAAVDHLFRVVCSLDSLVLGEAQIIGQVRRAFITASEAGCCGELFDELFRRALSVGKRAQSETTIGANSVSVATAAVDMVRETLGDLDERSVAVLGSGEMGTLAANYLVEEGVGDITVVNRTFSRAQALADELGAVARPMSELEDVLASTDLLIASVAADEPVVTEDMVRRVCDIRGGLDDADGLEGPDGDDAVRSQLVLLDIALPRSIEISCGDVDGALRFDLDDLDAIIERNQEKRREEVAHVEEIVAEETDSFLLWLQEREVTPTIRQMYEKAAKISHSEVEHAVKALSAKRGEPMSDEERAVLESMAGALANKILHGPTIRLRKQAGNPDAYLYTDAARFLFGLDVNPQGYYRNCEQGRDCRLARGGHCDAGEHGRCPYGNGKRLDEDESHRTDGAPKGADDHEVKDDA